MHPYTHPLFLNFIVYFNENQDYFECHEVLEEYWKSIPRHSKEHPLTAYILVATGMYHWRRDNFVGAERTLTKAVKRFELVPSLYKTLLNYNQLLADVQHSLYAVKQRKPFRSFLLYVHSAELEQKIATMKTSMTLLPFGSDAVIHKHMLRDRTDILQEREEKKKARLMK